MTTPLGKLLTDLIEPITRIRGTSKVAQSTVAILRAIPETNEKLTKDGIRDCVVWSMDVWALYPSL